MFCDIPTSTLRTQLRGNTLGDRTYDDRGCSVITRRELPIMGAPLLIPVLDKLGQEALLVRTILGYRARLCLKAKTNLRHVSFKGVCGWWRAYLGQVDVLLDI